jgi:uncharacterized caspase-like protein
MNKWLLWTLCLLLTASSLGGSVAAAPQTPPMLSAQAALTPRPEGPLALPAPGEASALLAAATLPAYADVLLAESQPNVNGSGNLELYLGLPDGQRMRALLDLPLWDLPPGITIQSATLRLCLSRWQDYAGYTRTIRAYRLTSLWHDAIASWGHQPTSAAEQVGSFNVGTPSFGSTPLWYDLDLTALARSWYDGSLPNYGLLLVGPESASGLYRAFASSETTVPPHLVINYTTTPASLSLGPQAFTFFADGQGTAVDNQALRISNPGSAPLLWDSRAGTNAWISVDPLTGTVGAGSTRTVMLNIKTAGLAKAAHQGKAQINAPGVPAKSANVTLNYLNRRAPYAFLPLGLRTFTVTPPAPALAVLLIGISDYEHMVTPTAQTRAGGIEDGEDCSYCRADGNAMQRMFARLELPVVAAQELASSAPPAIKLLSDAQASKADIRAAFTWLDEHEDANTLVLIGFSGHGGTTADDDGDEMGKPEGFICPYDTRAAGGLRNIIRDDELDQLISQLESRRVVVLLDTCHAGANLTATDAPRSITRRDGAVMLSDSDAAPSALGLRDIAKPGRVILAASRADQTSIESGALGHGVFSYYLLQALLDPAADADHDSWVSAEEAFAYLAPKVDSFALGRTGEHQNPVLYDGVTGPVNLYRP